MTPLNEQNLKRELVRAHLNRPEILIPQTWQHTVMREIRKIGLPAGRASFSSDFGAFVWRLVPAAGLLLILIMAGTAWFGPSADTVIADLLMSDPVDFVFNEILRG